jgi:hypothetical protein
MKTCTDALYLVMQVAQEILLPKNDIEDFPGKVVIFTGQRWIDIAQLTVSIQEIDLVIQWRRHLPAESVGKSQLYNLYGLWRRWITHEDTSLIPAPLPDLLAQFQDCDCHDKRDRVFALLSLTGDQSKIEVDYNMDTTELLRYVLAQSMDGKSIDELLCLGAVLVQALNIRNPQNDSLLADRVDDKEITNSDHREVPDIAVGSLDWAHATLEVLDESRDPDEQQYTSVTVQTITFPIFDAGNMHVFEYAVEETSTGVHVRYARAFEYICGQVDPVQCSNLVGAGSEKDNEWEYTWLQMPSEDVYYSRMSFSPYFCKSPPLRAWKSRSFAEEAVKQPVYQRVDAPCLMPSKRYWTQSTISWCLHVEFDMFPAALTKLEHQTKTSEQEARPKETQATQGTLVRRVDY